MDTPLTTASSHQMLTTRRQTTGQSLHLERKLITMSIRIPSDEHRTGYALKITAARTPNNRDLEYLGLFAHMTLVNKR